MEIGDYTVYEDNLDELGFNFLVAELKFTTTGSSIYVDLSDFVTSERTNLGQLEFYTSKLTEKTYDYKKLGVTSTVSSDTSSCSATVLIPYTNAKGELKVYYNSEVNMLYYHMDFKYFKGGEKKDGKRKKKPLL